MERRQYWALRFSGNPKLACVTTEMTPYLKLSLSVMRGGQVYITAQPRIESWSDEVRPWLIVLRTLSQPLPKV